MRQRVGRLNFCVIDRGRVWKDHMEMIMNEENGWYHDISKC